MHQKGAGMSEVAETVTRTFIARLAGNEFALGLRYAEWSARAPHLDAATLTVDAMAQHERGHARALFTLLHPEARDPESTFFASHEFVCIPFLRTPLVAEVDAAAVSFLFDGALSLIFVSMLAAAVPTIAALARGILREEQQHVAYAAAWVRRLSDIDRLATEKLRLALLRIWNETLCWFGPPDDAVMHALVAAGTLDAPPDVLRARLLAHIGPTTTAARLHLPSRRAAQGNTWQLTTALPWTRWDAARWQLDG